MTRDDLPLPPQRPDQPDDDPVAALAREVGRRAAETAKARAREKAQRRAARQAKVDDPGPGQPPTRARAADPQASRPARAPRPPRPADQDAIGATPTAAMAAAPALAIDTPGKARPAPGRRRGSSARRQSARRARRLRRTWLAATVLGAVSVLAVTGLYQLLGRAPAPLSNDAWAIASSDRGAPGPAPAPRAAAPGPVAQPAPAPRPPQAAPAMAAAPAAQPAPAAPTAGPAPPRITAAGRGATAVLPYIPGSQVVESDAEPQQAPGGGTTWAATLTSQGEVDKAAAYYRQLLSAEARPGGATLTEVTPGPGQLLLSLGNPGDGSHSAVWIGQSDGQVLIRLMRTQGPPTTP